jgi:hypothetical protein
MEYEGILPINKIDLSGYIPKKVKSLRSQFIDEAYIRLNSDREVKGLKPYTLKWVAIKINTSCKSDRDIHYLQKRCREGIFSKVFEGAIKAR